MDTRAHPIPRKIPRNAPRPPISVAARRRSAQEINTDRLRNVNAVLELEAGKGRPCSRVVVLRPYEVRGRDADHEPLEAIEAGELQGRVEELALRADRGRRQDGIGHDG